MTAIKNILSSKQKKKHLLVFCNLAPLLLAHLQCAGRLFLISKFLVFDFFFMKTIFVFKILQLYLKAENFRLGPVEVLQVGMVCVRCLRHGVCKPKAN